MPETGAKVKHSCVRSAHLFAAGRTVVRKEHAMEGVDIGAIITQILGLITGSSLNYTPGK